MHKKILWCGIASCLSILTLYITPVVSADNPAGLQSPGIDQKSPGMDQQSGDQNQQPPNQQSVVGTLEKVSESSISLKTSEGDVKIFDISEEKKNQIKSMGLKKGDSAIVVLDQRKQIVDVTKLGGG
jgi:hypothetical protein